VVKDEVSEAIAAEGYRVFELPSGAGHDGMAMIDIADVAMLFVRCRGGISHHPNEGYGEIVGSRTHWRASPYCGFICKDGLPVQGAN
jgi:hypothetical protein